MKIFAIVAKPKHPLAEPLMKEAISFLSDSGYSFITDTETSEYYPDVLTTVAKEIVPRSELTSKADCIIIFGGDGTLISVCRHPSENPPDIIGVNLGTLGFLTEIAPDEIIPTLEAYIQDLVKIESRPLMKVSVSTSDEHTEQNPSEYFSLNDVVIGKQALARIFGLRLSVSGEDATLIRGDGLIVSTPGGSTAYSLAAGGSIVHPGVDALLVTPICPHSLTSRPLVVPGSTYIDITLGPDCRADSVYLTVDGQEGVPLHKGVLIRILKSEYSITFVKSLSKSYFGILSNKLRWGQG
jgi:NAD+ kinase